MPCLALNEPPPRQVATVKEPRPFLPLAPRPNHSLIDPPSPLLAEPYHIIIRPVRLEPPIQPNKAEAGLIPLVEQPAVPQEEERIVI